MSDRFLTLGLLSAGLLLAALITQNGGLALLALPLLVYLGFGILESPSREKISLVAERSCRLTQTGSGPAVEVRVAVRNRGAALSVLRLSDRPQPGVTIEEKALRQLASPAPGEETCLTYTFPAARGGFQWSAVHAMVSDPFGLIETELDLPAAAEVLVPPRVKRFRPFPLRLESTLHSPGSVPARIGGTGTDFWGVREYRAGDPLRRLDWRRTARHPHQFFTRDFEREETADIGIILDASQGSAIRSAEDSLFEHALGAAASLVDSFLRRGNRVSLLMTGDEITVVYPGYGKVQLNRILRSLARARPGSRQGPSSLDHVPLRLFGRRALVVIISPLVSADLQVFPRLRARGHLTLLISPDPISFRRGSFPRDPASRLAVRLARVERRLELRGIGQLGVRVIDWNVHEPLSPLVRDALGASRAARR
jgi:uncharacterized protein (DUF58 family)